MLEVKVIGAGLAGCEAAWQLAERGIHVTLTEMKPDAVQVCAYRQSAPTPCAATGWKTPSAF